MTVETLLYVFAFVTIGALIIFAVCFAIIGSIASDAYDIAENEIPEEDL